MDVYIVAGEKNNGKSSIIHHLSGVERQMVTKISIEVEISIEIEIKPVDTFVKVQSLQEDDWELNNFMTKLPQKPFSAMLVALRTDLGTSADSYIDYFVKSGWNIKGVAELGGGTTLEKYCKQKNFKYESFERVDNESQVELSVYPKVKNFFKFA